MTTDKSQGQTARIDSLKITLVAEVL